MNKENELLKKDERLKLVIDNYYQKLHLKSMEEDKDYQAQVRIFENEILKIQHEAKIEAKIQCDKWKKAIEKIFRDTGGDKDLIKEKIVSQFSNLDQWQKEVLNMIYKKVRQENK